VSESKERVRLTRAPRSRGKEKSGYQSGVWFFRGQRDAWVLIVILCSQIRGAEVGLLGCGTERQALNMAAVQRISQPGGNGSVASERRWGSRGKAGVVSVGARKKERGVLVWCVGSRRGAGNQGTPGEAPRAGVATT